MATQYYADPQGRFIGGFAGSAQPPAGSTPVPGAPPDPSEFFTWNGAAWVEDADRADREADRDVAASFEGEKIKRLLFEINYDQENRIRALEGLGSITKAAYRTALINAYKAL